MLFPAELVIFITHHNFGPDIRLKFVDLILLGDSFLVRLRVREKIVDAEVFDGISLGEGKATKK
jgi:hypothetical protein